MFANHVSFFVEDRSPKWVLAVQFKEFSGKWTLFTWSTKPSDSEVDDAISLTLRAFDAYHTTVIPPLFKMTHNVIDDRKLT